jgi:hypothetical protein
VFEQVLVDGSLVGDSAFEQLVGLCEQYFVVSRATNLQFIDVFIVPLIKINLAISNVSGVCLNIN